MYSALFLLLTHYLLWGSGDLGLVIKALTVSELTGHYQSQLSLHQLWRWRGPRFHLHPCLLLEEVGKTEHSP